MPTEHIAVLEEARSALMTVRDMLHTDEAKAMINDRISAYDAAIALMRGQSDMDATEQRSLNQMADAWGAVVGTCLNIDRNALASYGPTGRESIVAFIKSLAKQERDDA